MAISWLIQRSLIPLLPAPPPHPLTHPLFHLFVNSIDWLLPDSIRGDWYLMAGFGGGHSIPLDSIPLGLIPWINGVEFSTWCIAPLLLNIPGPIYNPENVWKENEQMGCNETCWSWRSNDPLSSFLSSFSKSQIKKERRKKENKMLLVAASFDYTYIFFPYHFIILLRLFYIFS